MGAERRPRSHRRRRDTAVMPLVERDPPLSAPSRGRTALHELDIEPAISNAAPNARPFVSRSSRVLPLEGGDRGGSASSRMMSEYDISTRAHALSSLSRTLTTTATHLSHPLSRASFESKPRLQHHSTTAKCVATRSQRIHEMHHCDSGLHRIARPLSRTRNPLRGRRIRVSRRAAQR
jgi:hypothetical protein